jgi:hypothetical protein
MKRLLLLTGLASLLLPLAAQAQVNRSDCLSQLYTSLGREQRMFRAVVLGQRDPQDAAIGAVRFDVDAVAWTKTAENQWLSADPKRASLTDDGMRFALETDPLCKSTSAEVNQLCLVLPRKGILETKGGLTSELIPQITQSFRAFQCRLRALCDVFQQSASPSASATIRVQPAGCEPMEYPAFTSCKLQDPDTQQHATGYQVSFDACPNAVSSMLTHESNVLKAVVSYDAAYRTLLQFAGSFEEFVGHFRLPVFDVLSQTVRLMKEFEDLPCFLAQCNE